MGLTRRSFLRRGALGAIALAAVGLAAHEAEHAVPARLTPRLDRIGGASLAAASDASGGLTAPTATIAPLPVAPATTPNVPTTTPLPTRALATPTPEPPTPVPTPTPRPIPRQALVNVPYYSQRVGRLNYCLPASIAMVAAQFGRLPASIGSGPDAPPRYIADVALARARTRIETMTAEVRDALRKELGTDPLNDLIWNVFLGARRDLAAGMSPALGYLILREALDLTPELGTLHDCLASLADGVPSILFGSYGPLERLDGLPPNVGGYTGDHALVLVGIDGDRVLANDPLPTDRLPYAGRSDPATARKRAIPFSLESVRAMTTGPDGEPRGDLFTIRPL